MIPSDYLNKVNIFASDANIIKMPGKPFSGKAKKAQLKAKKIKKEVCKFSLCFFMRYFKKHR